MTIELGDEIPPVEFHPHYEPVSQPPEPPQPMVTMSFGGFSDERTIALFGAIAAAQGEFEPIIKNREVSIQGRNGVKYSFMYADLDSIRRSTQPALAKHGLGIISFPIQRQDGNYLRTLITHSGGGFMWAELLIPPVNGDDDVSQTIKAFGGLMTYLRRYLLIGMLNLSADHDLDEDGVEAGGKKGEAGPHTQAMMEAKTIQELARVMSGIPEKEKKNYLDLFNSRSNQLRQGAS